MKKSIVALLSICASTISFANSGCMSLAKTSWNGQVKLITGQIVKINNIVIDSVESYGGNFFKITGSIDGQAMVNDFGCDENEPGKIASIGLENDSTSMMSLEFAPNNQNPTRINGLSGRWKGQFIDTTTDRQKNFLQRN